VGSGNSTQLFRAAITDGKLRTALVSIDPSPRTAIGPWPTASSWSGWRTCQRPISPTRCRTEISFSSIQVMRAAPAMTSSSCFLKVIPALRAGCGRACARRILHSTIRGNGSSNIGGLERAVSGAGNAAKVERVRLLWPAHFLQRTWPGFAGHFDENIQGQRLLAVACARSMIRRPLYVAILTGNHLCHNPRVIKEAAALANAALKPLSSAPGPTRRSSSVIRT